MLIIGGMGTYCRSWLPIVPLVEPILCGGGWFTTQELSIRTQACQLVLERECAVVIKTQP